MGLTVNQSDQLLRMINEKYFNLAQEKERRRKAENDAIFTAFLSDPRISPLFDDYREVVGPFSSGLGWGMYYDIRDSVRNSMETRWDSYLADKSSIEYGKGFRVLEELGYTGPTRATNFYNSPLANQMQMALRTTRQNWGKIAAPYAELTVNLTLATTMEEVLKHARDFTDALR